MTTEPIDWPMKWKRLRMLAEAETVDPRMVTDRLTHESRPAPGSLSMRPWRGRVRARVWLHGVCTEDVLTCSGASRRGRHFENPPTIPTDSRRRRAALARGGNCHTGIA
jgi:hypothetical protein